MTQETINLIMGGLIGIIGVLIGFIGTILANILNHEWELENRRHNEKRQILIQRIKDAEILTNINLEVSDKIKELENYFLIPIKDNDKVNQMSLTALEMMSFIKTKSLEVSKSIGTLNSIGDSKLMEDAESFRKLIFDESHYMGNFLADYMDKLKDGIIDKTLDEERPKQFFSNAIIIHAKIITRLDEILIG